MISPMVPFTLHIVTIWCHSLVTQNSQNLLKKNIFVDAYLHKNLLLYIQTCSMGQLLVSTYPMMSPMELFTLLTPYKYSMGQDNHYPWLKLPGICRKHLFLSNFTAITFCSTRYIVFWAYEWCPAILWYHPMCFWHLWPHIVTLWAIIDTHPWQKMAKNHWKTFLWWFLLPEPPMLPLTFFCRLMKCVQLPYDITYCTVYIHDPM